MKNIVIRLLITLFVLLMIYAKIKERYDFNTLFYYYVYPRNSFMEFNFVESYWLFIQRERRFLLPENIRDNSGEEILSWRVTLALVCLSEGGAGYIPNTIKTIDLQSSWDSPLNLRTSTAMPWCFFYPSFEESTDGNKTCAVRIEEIHEKLKAGELPDNEKDKAYIVLISAKDSVPWMKPQDISWKDLAEHRVELFPYGRHGAIYISAGGEIKDLPRDKIPDSYEDWKSFCGTD